MHRLKLKAKTLAATRICEDRYTLLINTYIDNEELCTKLFNIHQINCDSYTNYQYQLRCAYYRTSLSIVNCCKLNGQKLTDRPKNL